MCYFYLCNLFELQKIVKHKQRSKFYLKKKLFPNIQPKSLSKFKLLTRYFKTSSHFHPISFDFK